MSEIRVKKVRHYSVVPRAFVEDQRLCAAAVRLGSWLASHSDTFIVHKEHARRVLGLGQDLWAKAIKELKVAGYLRTGARQDLKSGKWQGHDYEIDLGPGD